MAAVQISPARFHQITLVCLVALTFIVITGGAVRLTGSGLGCPDWPTCEEGRVIAPLEYHAMVEFINRVITGLVSLAVILAVAGSALRGPRRKDLMWLSLGLVIGVLGQVALGALTVIVELSPPFVMAHFILSMVLICNAVVLHSRAGREEGAPGATSHTATVNLMPLARVMLIACAIVVFTGTIVTGSGPHGGDEDVSRLPFLVPDVARVHGTSVFIFVTIVLLLIRQMHRSDAGKMAQQRGSILLGVVIMQAAVGYTQYFTGVPVLLVGIHIAGAALVWIFTLRLYLALSEIRPPAGSKPHAPAETMRVEVLAGS